ncbi:ArsR family transcriptional regulator [Micromonospora endolithica]|uniref:ArsR family transcriptional regulator n=1 Tax=Micromonospora endolithica TaxID=230091 RepID=A0A3A9Z2V5_9ACTN|nr:ArsR family transcriptional regulator [Micromonospora endolithica]RKN42623.1 ArsR family transcriptional regulator [Micromonospora endolithica]TWJ19995.1 helix-turn-helix protein [Micromonospora endolithica]
MIRIRLDEPTLARTRIATSPLWEVLTSLYVLHRNPGEAPWPYTGWARHARRVLAEVPATAPVRLLTISSRAPDFLTPIPSSASPTLAEQLAELRATPAEVIAEQIPRYHRPDDLPAWLRTFVTDRRAALDRLADGVEAYWNAAIAPWWPAMRAALDEEVLHRARALAADGPDALLAHLHERVRWEKPVLTLVKPLEQHFEAVDQRLLLVPLIFSRGALTCSTDHPEVVAVSYQARGAALLAEGTPAPATPAGTDRLAVLVGRGRAQVLRALTRPATTAGLAATLGLAPSTVSEQLAALLTAGVVHRRRVGRRVLYGLEPAGLALVQLIGDEPVTASA